MSLAKDECRHDSWECKEYRHVCTDCGHSWAKVSWDNCAVCAEVKAFVTKDSGERVEYDSGMRRDVQTGKPRFDLLVTDDQPYEEQFLTRIASLLNRGAEKYGEKNWQLADSEEEMNRFRASGLRHMMQWTTGETDEDHAAAVVFNLLAYEYVKWKRNAM